MEIGRRIQSDKSAMQLCFLDLLYKEGLIIKETYYAAKVVLRSECKRQREGVRRFIACGFELNVRAMSGVRTKHMVRENR